MSVLLYSSDVALVCDIDFNPTTQYLLLLTNSKLRLTFIGGPLYQGSESEFMTFKCCSLKKFMALIWDHLMKMETFDSRMHTD